MPSPERIRKLVERAKAGRVIIPKRDNVTVPMAYAIIAFAFPEADEPFVWIDSPVYEQAKQEVEAACTKS
jgi:hypothetical protein